MIGDNQPILPSDLRRIRALDDFDLGMFLSEIHDHGLPVAMDLLPIIETAIAAIAARQPSA